MTVAIVRRVGELAPRPSSAEELLMTKYTANDLRKWTSSHDITRKRGDNKLETARRAIEQQPDVVLDELGVEVKAMRLYHDTSYEELQDEARFYGFDGWIKLHVSEDTVRVGFF